MIAYDYPSGVTYWRRLRFWEEKGIFLKTLYRLLDILIVGKRLDCSVVSIDGTLIPSYEFKEVTGYSGKHRQVGVKVSVLVDKHGIPLSFSYAPGNYHDQILSYPTLKNSYSVPKQLQSLAKVVFQGRRSLLADRGYDSLYFRRFANIQGYDPHIPSRVCVSKEKSEDPLYRLDATLYKKRNVIERTNSWLKSSGICISGMIDQGNLLRPVCIWQLLSSSYDARSPKTSHLRENHLLIFHEK